MIALTALWAVLLTGAYLAPHALPDDDPADVVTRQTARVAVLYWGIAAAAILLSKRDFGRWSWTLGCVAFLLHVVTAFELVHGWSNSAAVRHVEDVSGFGPGLYVSYSFTALWVVDAAWWWLDREVYESRPVWLDRARAFAMAAIAQCREARARVGRGRYSLWTGDVGLACYLWDCLTADPRFPTVDVL